jgi:ABC-2 type transport system ATP-binding protein
VAGYDVVREAEQVRRSIGYVSQSGSTGGTARAGDEVTDHGMLYGMTTEDAKRRGHELFDQLELDGLWGRQPKSMSGGQRRRLDIAMGLIHEPRLVFLDEPTTGLDPQARANLWTHIGDLRDRRGATVLLTTHYLDEADHLSDRIVVIDHGKIVASDTPDNLKAQVSGDLVDLEIADAAHVATAAERLAAVVTHGSGSSTSDAAQDVEVDGQHVRGRVQRAGVVIPGLLRDLDQAGITLTSIEVRRPTLDDVFLTVTGRSLRDG